MGLKLSNNAASTLAASISAAATSLTLSTGDGSRFPAISSGEWFPLTLVDGATVEILKVTARAGDVLTVTRAQEGTSASEFDSGVRAELRMTQGAYAEMILPPGTGPLPWSLPTEPDGWIFCDGRTLLSSTDYGALRAAYISAGFPYGQDGSGNPKIPDMRGRVPAGLDNAAGRLTGATLGAALGAQTHTLSAAEMPVHAHGVTDPTHTHSLYDAGHSHSASQDDHSHTHSGGATQSDAAHGLVTSGTGLGYGGRAILTTGSGIINTITSSGASASAVYIGAAGTGMSVYGNATGVSIQNAGSGSAHANVQPTLATNYIVKT